MATNPIEVFLSTCPSPEDGCFASDNEAFGYMLGNAHDALLTANFRRASEASTAAAIQGKPIEEATYAPAILTARDGSEFEGGVAELGSSDTTRSVLATETEHDRIAKMNNRIVRCAYVCGATAVGCPLRTPSEPQEKVEFDNDWPPIEYIP